jgi:Arc/MetJ family transcription regulator
MPRNTESERRAVDDMVKRVVDQDLAQGKEPNERKAREFAVRNMEAIDAKRREHGRRR